VLNHPRAVTASAIPLISEYSESVQSRFRRLDPAQKVYQVCLLPSFSFPFATNPFRLLLSATNKIYLCNGISDMDTYSRFGHSSHSNVFVHCTTIQRNVPMIRHQYTLHNGVKEFMPPPLPYWVQMCKMDLLLQQSKQNTEKFHVQQVSSVAQRVKHILFFDDYNSILMS
jgi:hypothetical protein